MFERISTENKVFISTLINEYSDLLRKLIDNYEIYDVGIPKNRTITLLTNKKYKPEDLYGIMNVLELRVFYWGDYIILFLIELAKVNNKYSIPIPNKDGKLNPEFILHQIRKRMIEIIKENNKGG